METNEPKWTIKSKGRLRKEKATEKVVDFTEHHLCYEGKSCHILTGEIGRQEIRKLADEYNDSGYEPKFQEGKVYLELTQGQREKLAQTHSPLLPFASEVRA